MPSNSSPLDWTPIAILPNLSGRTALEGDVIALAPSNDPRIQTLCVTYPNFEKLISQFTNAFKKPLQPITCIVRSDALEKIAHSRAISSFRDLVAMSVIPYHRAHVTIYRRMNHIVYSNSFWLYPWMLDKNNKRLVAHTPDISALHDVSKFQGQSSPELSIMPLDDIDQPLFSALLSRWKRYYLGNRSRWQDHALFRSLNMATQAAQLPAGSDTTTYDLGRMIALWVSAFEILAHPRTDSSGLKTVYPLLEKVSHITPKAARQAHIAYMGRTQKPSARRVFSCWLYGRLYQARCDFLHGNPLRKESRILKRGKAKIDLFWIAPSLYRLALAGFLGLTFKERLPAASNAKAMGKYIARSKQFNDYQKKIEQSLFGNSNETDEEE
jgi:hypothetical protein